MVLTTHAAYLIVSIALTVWVARTLHRNGRVFLVDAFGGNERLADSTNHLLVVGFYLLNLGYISLAVRFGDHPVTDEDAIEILTTKLGLVMLALGSIHLINVSVFSRMRRRREQMNLVESYGDAPPVQPDTRLTSSRLPDTAS